MEWGAGATPLSAEFWYLLTYIIVFKQSDGICPWPFQNGRIDSDHSVLTVQTVVTLLLLKQSDLVLGPVVQN